MSFVSKRLQTNNFSWKCLDKTGRRRVEWLETCCVWLDNEAVSRIEKVVVKTSNILLLFAIDYFPESIKISRLPN